MVFVGLISYPLYLWHWPMLSFARILEVKLPSWTVRISLVFASIVLAWITYRFVERPIRFGSRKKSKTAALVLIMLLVMGLGYLTHQGSMPWRVPPQKEAHQIEFSKNDFKFPPVSFVAGSSGRIVSYTHAGILTPEKKLFLGDSNLEQYGPRIEKVILEATEPTNGAMLIPIQKNCDIFFSVFTGQGCENQIEEAYRISIDENIKKLVIAVSWLKYEKPLEEAAGRIALAGFLKKISHGKQVLIIRNIPRDPENLPPDSLYIRRLSAEGGKIEIIKRVSPMSTYGSTFGGVDNGVTTNCRCNKGNAD